MTPTAHPTPQGHESVVTSLHQNKGASRWLRHNAQDNRPLGMHIPELVSSKPSGANTAKMVALRMFHRYVPIDVSLGVYATPVVDKIGLLVEIRSRGDTSLHAVRCEISVISLCQNKSTSRRLHRYINITVCGGSRVGMGGGTQCVHGRSRMTIDPRVPTMPGRSTSCFHQPGRHCLHQA